MLADFCLWCVFVRAKSFFKKKKKKKNNLEIVRIASTYNTTKLYGTIWKIISNSNINKTSVIIFLVSSLLTLLFFKTPSDGTCLGEPPGGFCDVGSFCSSFIAFWRFCDVFLHSLLFDVIPCPSVSYRQVFRPILYFQPCSSQSDLRHFHFNLSGPFCYSFAASATDLREHFVLLGVFYLTLLPNIWHNLLLSGLPWELAVLPWRLQGLPLRFETQTRPICSFDSHNVQQKILVGRFYLRVTAGV